MNRPSETREAPDAVNAAPACPGCGRRGGVADVCRADVRTLVTGAANAPLPPGVEYAVHLPPLSRWECAACGQVWWPVASVRVSERECRRARWGIMKTLQLTKINPGNAFVPAAGDRVRVVGGCHPDWLGRVCRVTEVGGAAAPGGRFATLSWPADGPARMLATGRLGNLTPVPPDATDD